MMKQYLSLKEIMKQLARAFPMPGLMAWAERLEDPLDYEDPYQRQEIAKRNCEELNNKIMMLRRVGLYHDQDLGHFVNNPGHFSYQEWDSLQQIKENLRDYEVAVEKVAPPLVEEQPFLKGKKKRLKKGTVPKRWIPS